MVIALLLLLVVLSLPTIMQLNALLGANRATPHRALPAKSSRPQHNFQAPSSSRLSLVRSQAGPAERTVVETQLAH